MVSLESNNRRKFEACFFRELENLKLENRLAGTKTLWDQERLIKFKKLQIFEFQERVDKKKEERVDTLDLF